MLRGRTFEEDATTMNKSARSRDNDRSYGSTFDGAARSTTLGVGDTPQYRVSI
jgi:hypothetical protein